MQGYPRVNLLDILKQNDEKFVSNHLKNFQCPFNTDVEDFIQNKAITFALQGLAGVWLVFASFQGKYVLVGYFALANKHFHIDLKALSNNSRKKVQKFANFDLDLHKYIVSAPLIGQLGKNFANSYNNLITGDELLKIACDTVKESQRILGGKLVYLECENNSSLISFYERNGFYNFGKRNLDRDEKDMLNGDYLLQFFKYLKD